jgi:CDP-glucose 4,6-dehydratase
MVHLVRDLMGDWSRRSVLVTGAGGFVGSWLAAALADAGASVTVVLRDEPVEGNFKLLGLGSRTNIVRGDITDQALMDRAINEYDIDSCFHLAAQAIVGAANRAPISTFDSNIRGTWTVLEACRTSTTVQRVVVASSDKAYGTQPVLPYTEDMPLLGRSPYDASKAITDILAASYHSAFGTPVVVARCANVYGGGDVNFSRLVPGTIRSALQGERPVIRSDGTPVRDYIHVDDAVAAYLLLGERAIDPAIAGQAFNFGTNQPVAVLDLTREILAGAGREDLEPDIRGTGVVANEIDRQYLDSTKAATVLGWQATIPRPDGIARAISWYRDHPGEAGATQA